MKIMEEDLEYRFTSQGLFTRKKGSNDKFVPLAAPEFVADLEEHEIEQV